MKSGEAFASMARNAAFDVIVFLFHVSFFTNVDRCVGELFQMKGD